jgi:ribose transport system permease protein
VKVPSPSRHTRLGDVTIQVMVMAGLLMALVTATGLFNENFFNPFTLRGVARDTAILSLFALGQAVVIISGGIDLSVGSLIAFVGVTLISLLNRFDGMPLVVAVLIVMALAAVVGLMHGLLICLLDLQPFLVTLCSLLVFRGLSRVLTGDSVVAYNPESRPWLTGLGDATVLGAPLAVYVLVAAFIPLALFMHFTVPGRHLHAIGSNLQAARYSGVSVSALRITSYVICAVMTALAAVLEAGSIGSVTPSSAGLAYEMYGITAAVLGGCALRGGRGSLLGVIIGAAMLRVLRSAVIFLDISTYWTFAVTGLVLLFAVVIDALVRQRRERAL